VGTGVSEGITVGVHVAAVAWTGTWPPGICSVPAAPRSWNFPSGGRSQDAASSTRIAPPTVARPSSAGRSQPPRRGAPQARHSVRLRTFSKPQFRQRIRRAGRSTLPHSPQINCAAGTSLPQRLHTLTRSLPCICFTLQALVVPPLPGRAEAPAGFSMNGQDKGRGNDPGCTGSGRVRVFGSPMVPQIEISAKLHDPASILRSFAPVTPAFLPVISKGVNPLLCPVCSVHRTGRGQSRAECTGLAGGTRAPGGPPPPRNHSTPASV
jgi:hypothetical protein